VVTRFSALSAIGLVAVILSPSGSSASSVNNATVIELKRRLFPATSQWDLKKLPPPAQRVLKERAIRRKLCGLDVACRISAEVWTADEMQLTADVAASQPNSRQQILYELRGINAILAVYGQGLAPRYPAIDGPDLTLPKVVEKNVKIAVELAGLDPDSADTDEPSLNISASLLYAAGRIEAIQQISEQQKLNKATSSRARFLKWKTYKYSVILALGVGPDDLKTPLSASSKLNVARVARLYFDKQAPIIVVSGANVHPRGTDYYEAFEMQKALIEDYSVPAEAILVEPFARHTTTNLRDTCRLLKSVGAPLDQTALMVSNVDHINYAASGAFTARAMNDLGYVPATIGNRASPTSLEFRPNPICSLIDPSDPLDP